MAEIKLDRINVNDDEHTILALLVTDGTRVTPGTPIAEIETSKATVELEASESGPIRFLVEAGDLVKVGAPFCVIGESGSTVADTTAPADKSRLPDECTQRDNAGVQPMAGKGFKTNRPYRQPRTQSATSTQPATTRRPATKPATNPDKRKAAEIASLSVVNPTGLVSCLVRKFDIAERTHQPWGLFAANISDLIIYECAKLITKYPKLNARFDDTQGHALIDDVRFGYSIDVDNDLAVYNLGDCRTMALNDVRSAIEGCVEAHVTKKASATQLKPSTITLTDLSASGLDSFFPLINGAQSCIIGYSKPTNDTAALSFSFDHRVMGGKYAADFLNELTTRVASHFTAKTPTSASCDFCGKDATTLREFREKGLLRVVTPDGEEANCCRVCFENW